MISKKDLLKRIEGLEKEIIEEDKGEKVDYVINWWFNPWDTFFPKKTLRERVVEIEKMQVESQKIFSALTKYLGLEYYKKEVKETNGETKQYTEEGFRPIARKVGRPRKKAL